MRRWIPLIILTVITFFSAPAFATHIVGGSLTYVHNGGSSYTVTLKLYRDCGPGTAGLPGNVTISVRGYNGAEFNPSRDITMPLSQVTPVLPTLDPCAIPPNPMPCVEEGLYTATVNNLPPNPGGYHMYYQIIARNLTLVNVDAVCNCIGETFYAYIPGTSSTWSEDFTLADGTTIDGGATAWSVANGATPPNSGQVNGNLFEFTGANNSTATWTSEIINISALVGGADLSVQLSEQGNFENSDNISVFYSLDGGAQQLFATNGNFVNDFGNATATQTGLIGNTVQIFVQVNYGGNSPTNERYQIDNVAVFGNDFQSNDNAEFNLFPPLFLCVNQPFTFDHSATDNNGDSLVYSFYDPYDGDNGAGPLDPTYVTNTAVFTPIVWQPGFGTNNPLGGPALTLDPNTGLMSGTPTMLGQFVVGVKVTSYRNGQYLDETLRDFQFNVLNCPQPNPPVAGADITINDGCTDQLQASGYVDSTVTWTSINPGAPGTYDGFLSCTTGCLDPNVTATGTPPAFVDYVICGNAASCNNAFICDTVRVNFNPSLQVTISPQTPTICFGQTNVTLTAQGSGGTPPYSYLWNNVNPSQTNIVGAGTYTVELSDSSGCPPVYATVVVNAFTVPITADAGGNDTVCTQNPVVPLNGTVTGATGGLWSGGGGTFSPNDSSLTGFYTPTQAEINAGSVTLFLNTTGNGTCPPDADTITITFLPFLGTANVVTTDLSCFGGNDGTATANITGGVAPFTYQWNSIPPQTTQTISNLDLGAYDVTITNAYGCTTTATGVVNQPAPLVASVVPTDVTCNGGTDGAVNASISGGTGPYTYSWSNGPTTQNISNVGAGNYTITVTDANGCTATATATVNEPTALTIGFTTTDVTCNGGSDGTATGTPTGGTAGYTYSWAPTGGNAPSAIGLAAGNYDLTVTDANGCTTTSTVTVNEPTPMSALITTNDETCDYLDDGDAFVSPAGGTPAYSYLWSPGGQTTATISNVASGTHTVTITDQNGCTFTTFAVVNEPPAIVLTTSQVDVNCFNGNDGQAAVNASGGTPGYTYSWNPGAQTTAAINNLTTGTYTATVTDNNGCQATTSVTIAQPAAAVSSTGTVTDVSCNGGNDGSIDLTAAGGTAPYTYLWLPGGQTTEDISGLTAGTYTVTVTDINGCTSNDTYTVNEPNPLAVNFTVTAPNCNGGNDGSITAGVTGGTAGYSFSWSPSGSASPTVNGLSAGTHIVTVTDNQGCVFVDSTVMTEPTAITVTASATDETCDYLDDGTATANATGGTGAFTYNWMPGNIAGGTITNQPAGNYTVTATDANGCTASETVTINEPAAIAISFGSQVNVSCFGGTDGAVTATPTGGTPNYTFSWVPSGQTTASVSGISAGTNTVTVTDQNGCQASNSVNLTSPAELVVTASSTNVSCFGGNDGSATLSLVGGTGPYSYLWTPPGNLISQTINNRTADTYTVVVTDANGCMDTSSTTVTEPAPIVLSTGSVSSNCGFADGQASVSVTSGGTGPFTYSWAPSGQTTAVATNLLAGLHTVTVTDANGCTETADVNVNDLAAPNLIISSTTNVSCFGGSDGAATVTVGGGVGPFTYSWSPSGGSAATATGLPAGTYTVTVTGSNGCVSSATTVPSITQPDSIIMFVSTTDVDCNGAATGAASVTAIGGTAPYTFTWLPGGTNGNSVGGLTAGVYTVNIVDANGCSGSMNFTINEPASALAVTASGTNISCNGGSDGTVTSVVAGGTAPYAYNWTPGNISGTSLSNLTAGNYTITITDANGCTTNDNVTLTEPTVLTLAPGSTNSTCGFSNGQASVTAGGGTPGYTYQWSPTGGVAPVATGLAAGNYVVTVTDNNGCQANTAITVSNTAGPSASVTGTTNVSCFGGADGTATATVTGGTAPFTYLWTPGGATTATATGLTSGIYGVVVTDANGCQSQVAFTPQITQPNPIVISIGGTDVSCNGGADGTATAAVNGGTPGYTYSWLPGGSTGPSVSGLTAGLDSVTVTDANGCTATTTFIVNEPTVLSSSLISSSDVSCFGGADGTASVSVTGGTPLYSYTWLPQGGNGSTATGLPAGNYTLNTTDQNGCTTSTNVTINEPASALAATASSTPVSCAGGTDGTVTATPVGGTPGYTYLWSPSGAITQTVNNLGAGTQNVQVTDANGCIANATVVVQEPTPLTASTIVVPPSCGLNNGSIGTVLTGGTAPYTYAWLPGGATTSVISGLAPGGYSVVITDANNCSVTLSENLVNIPGPTVAIATTTDVSCYGGNDGSATATITGGTTPYAINWSPYGGGAITAAGLDTGSYVVTVTDALGCVGTATAVINEPTLLDVSATAITDVSCAGAADGTVTVNASGGTGPYTYLWSPGSIPGATLSNLGPGSYGVTATDANGCTTDISVQITEPTAISSAIANTTNPSCATTSDGTATVNVIGGTPPYTYLWSNGEVNSTTTNLTGGTTTVQITDANGCIWLDSVTLVQPLPIITVAGPNDTICLGQTASVSASATGGVGNYSYAWQPLGVVNSGVLNPSPVVDTEYIVVAYDQNGCPGNTDTVSVTVLNLTQANLQVNATANLLCPGQSSIISAQTVGINDPVTFTWNNGLGTGPGPFTVTPMAPTTYVVTATNSCGLQVQDSVTLLFSPPPTLQISADADSACVPGVITFTDSSVTGNPSDQIHLWFWDFGDGTSSQLQDPVHTYDQPGTYQVTLTIVTGNGCSSDNLSNPITITILPSPQANFTVSSNELELPIDWLNATNLSTGATAYEWNFDDGSFSTEFEPSHLYDEVGTFTVQLVALNAIGCSDTAQLTIETFADLIFPNAFTPAEGGGNGGYYDVTSLNNDIFFPYTAGVQDYQLQIFDRWGELIFETTDINQGWDGYYRGKLVQQGVYIWKARAVLNDGRIFDKIGDVTLLR